MIMISHDRSGNSLTFTTDWVYVVSDAPVIESVSELQMFDYFPLSIYGTGFVDTGEWQCKYRLFDIDTSGNASFVVSNNATYFDETEIACNIPELPVCV